MIGKVLDRTRFQPVDGQHILTVMKQLQASNVEADQMLAKELIRKAKYNILLLDKEDTICKCNL